MSSPLTSLISQAALSRGVDPRAALAVAGQEGLSGRIGDNGTSFGPFQLHFGGAYPSEAPHDPTQAQAWASSPAGVDYAMNAIAKIAHGLSGPAAVKAIVSQFERPADVAGETQRALQGYGGTPGTPGMAGSVGGTSPVAPQGASGLTVQGLLGSLLSGGDSTNYLLKALQVPQAQPHQQTQPQPQQVPNLFAPGGSSIHFSGVPVHGENPDLLNRIQAAAHAVGASEIIVTSAKRAPGPGNDVKNSNHITGNAMDGYAVINGRHVPLGQALLPVASKFGLRSGDVAGFDPRTPGGWDPVHVDDGANVNNGNPIRVLMSQFGLR